jgi:hypothetical protein
MHIVCHIRNCASRAASAEYSNTAGESSVQTGRFSLKNPGFWDFGYAFGFIRLASRSQKAGFTGLRSHRILVQSGHR